VYLVLTTVAVYLCCVKRRWVPIPDATLPDLNLLSVPKGPASPAAGSRHNELYVLLLFLIYLFLTTDCCPTNYLNIYRTDLRQTFKVARRTKSALWLLNMGHYTHTLTYLLTYLLTMGVDDQPEIVFSIRQGKLPRQPTSVGFDRRLTLGTSICIC